LKLPGYRRIFSSDFDPKDQSLVEKLSVPVNNGVEVLFEALNNKLDFRNNFQASIRDVQVEVDSNGVPTGTSSFALINSNRVEGILVLRAENLTNSSIYPSGAPFVSFLQNSDRITITHISGLQANNTYSLRLLAI